MGIYDKYLLTSNRFRNQMGEICCRYKLIKMMVLRESSLYCWDSLCYLARIDQIKHYDSAKIKWRPWLQDLLHVGLEPTSSQAKTQTQRSQLKVLTLYNIVCRSCRKMEYNKLRLTLVDLELLSPINERWLSLMGGIQKILMTNWWSMEI